LFFLVIILCNSYIGYRTTPIKERNLNFYVFHLPLTVLRDSIIKDFTTDRSKGTNDLINVQDLSRKSWDTITSANKYSKEVWYYGIFEKPENIYNLYLYSNVNPAISYSKIYHKFWKPLEYSAEFHLHFVPVNKKEIKTEVFTYDSQALYWGLTLPGGDHALVKF
jgi:hypothetical protein